MTHDASISRERHKWLICIAFLFSFSFSLRNFPVPFKTQRGECLSFHCLQNVLLLHLMMNGKEEKSRGILAINQQCVVLLFHNLLKNWIKNKKLDHYCLCESYALSLLKYTVIRLHSINCAHILRLLHRLKESMKLNCKHSLTNEEREREEKRVKIVIIILVEEEERESACLLQLSVTVALELVSLESHCASCISGVIISSVHLCHERLWESEGEGERGMIRGVWRRLTFDT